MSGKRAARTDGKRKLVSEKSQHEVYSVDSGIGEDEPSYDEEFAEEEVEDRILHIRNITASWLKDWGWVSFLRTWGCQFAGTFVFIFFQLNANYVFPGMWGSNQMARTGLIAAVVFFVTATFGKYTTMYLDPFRTIGGTITFVLTRGKDMSKGYVWMDVLKNVVALLAQWIAVLMAFTLLGVTMDTPIKTLDCSAEPVTPAVCDIYPTRAPFVTINSLYALEILGNMIIYGMLIWGERWVGWRGNKSFLNGLVAAAGPLIAHGFWSGSSGGSFNFWFWSHASWFTNIADDATARVWPGIVGITVVVIIDVVVYYVYANMSVLRAQYSKLGTKRV